MVYAIVVTFNGEQWIEKCLGSLISSEVMLKIIVVDNGSEDDTLRIIESKFTEVTIIKTNRNLGFGRANNLGIKMALKEGADYIFLLNQDAWIEQNTVSYLVNKLSKNEEYGVLSPFQLNGKHTEIEQGFIQYIVPDNCKLLISDLYLNNIKDKIYEVAFVNAASWLISRTCLLEIGGFNPLFFQYGEDINFVHRLHYKGYKVGICPQVIIGHDRNQREDSIFFRDKKIKFERNVKIAFLNPALSDPGKTVRKEILKQIFDSLFNKRATNLKDALSLVFIYKRIKCELRKRKIDEHDYFDFS
jgi:GT2 family glycosyltransferase